MSNQQRTYRILVVHGEPIAAAGLLAALRSEHGFELSQASSQNDEIHPFHVVITDHRTAMGIFTQAKQQLLPRYLHSTSVIVLSGRLSATDIRQAVAEGARGYLRLDCSIEEFTLGVRTVALGSRYFCTAVARQIADSMMGVALTAREEDVLRQLILGQCNKTIAKSLASRPAP